MSLEAKAIAVVILLVALASVGWRIDQQGYKRAQAEYQAAAELQREGNRGRARAAEERYTARAEQREHFIVTTVTEVRHDTENLAACRLSADAVQRLRRAAECAGENRPASCGAGEQVRDAGATP